MSYYIGDGILVTPVSTDGYIISKEDVKIYCTMNFELVNGDDMVIETNLTTEPSGRNIVNLVGLVDFFVYMNKYLFDKVEYLENPRFDNGFFAGDNDTLPVYFSFNNDISDPYDMISNYINIFTSNNVWGHDRTLINYMDYNEIDEFIDTHPKFFKPRSPIKLTFVD